MTLSIHSTCLYGMTPYLVTLNISAGGTLKITGIPEAQARETAVRVMSALAHVGVRTTEPLPDVDIVGYVTGSTAHLDLQIAVAVLDVIGVHVPSVRRPHYGELSLAGDIRPVRGLTVLLGHILDGGSRQAGSVVPVDNELEAADLDGEHLVAGSLRELIDDGGRPARGAQPLTAGRPLLLVAKPGDGALLATRDLSRALFFRRSRELDAIYSVAGLLPREGAVTVAPFRAPHHSVSTAGLVGGGTSPRPGEVSLAHRGVLLLDQVQEFRKDALDALFHALLFGSVICGGGPSRLRSIFPAAPALVVAVAPPGPQLTALVKRHDFTVASLEAGVLRFPV